ncbi:hypothetical protein [Thalassobellus suaedae]|uniref:ATP synthase F0 subunit B n=1 Tax=Thalassobellus suaedae TaxID=3074124 RepID=A0ABY9XPR4_9FLAO|nr:hypothetical protein RHP51_11425 [Flavobacteriaceae bacterium HL-DH14]WNH13123.1 hypothetical protein RHP49_02460 [Flavobacteriaceae bacterium HL-DH10]
MENGYVILGIIALLFLSMYGYAYFSVSIEKIRQKREAKRLVAKEELRKQERLEKQKIIDEKVKKFNDRKEEIHHELMLLEKMKNKQKVS